MTTEVEAAQAVVEAKVDAQVAGQEATAATVAAVAAEHSAVVAVEAAREAEAIAERAEDRAALDAEARITKYEGELATCRTEIAGLRTLLTEFQSGQRSIQETLTGLAWLKELEMTEEMTQALASRASATSSKTDGSTSASDDGKTSKPETSSDGGKPAAVSPDAKPEASEKPSSAADRPARKRLRWL